MSEVHITITPDEIKNWCTGSFGTDFTHDYLFGIITGTYNLDEAREDILSFRKQDEVRSD